MGFRRRNGAVILIAAVAVLAWGAAAAAGSSSRSTSPYLVVERDDGEVLAEVSLATAAVWVVRWNHSVTGIEVSDYYALEKGSMVLTESHTPAFDAGLGHIPGRGRLESDGEGGYWIRDLDEPVPGNAYRLRVGSARVDHRIVHAGSTISLSALAAGERVTIRIVWR